VAADQPGVVATVLALLADHQQADFRLQFAQATHQIAVALTQLRLGRACIDDALPGRIEQHAALFQRQLVAFFIQRGEFFQQKFATAQADDAAEVARKRVALLVQHMQQAQGRSQAQGGPGRAIADGRGLRRSIDTCQYLGHSTLLPQWLMSFSTASGLSCTPKRSTMVALAWFSPSTWTSVPSRRNLSTTLSSAETAVMSQKCAWVRSMVTLATASLKSNEAANLSAELKNTWPATL